MSKLSLLDRFESEIEEVQSTLMAATADLTNPLGELVRGQIRQSQPPICGATVLAVSMRVYGAPEDDDLHHKRILLAAALEMLHVALNVHRLLVNAALTEQKEGSEDLLDRAFIGSTILAGDYCFSRAAQLAAQTDHPQVVTTFSLALQTVSEELLREQFHGDVEGGSSTGGTYDETRQLLQSGAHAAAQLVDLPFEEQQQAISLSKELATQWSLYRSGTTSGESSWFASQRDALPANWQVLYQWLMRQRANGELSSVTSPSHR